MAQHHAVNMRSVDVTHVDAQANYVPAKYIIDYVIAVLLVTWRFVGLAIFAGIVAGTIAGAVEGVRAHASVRTPIGNIPGGVGSAVGSAVVGAYFLPFTNGSASTIAGFILLLIISSISTFWNVKTKG
jgi:hypothetical protein